MKFSKNIFMGLIIATSFSINMQASQDSDSGSAKITTMAAVIGGLCFGVLDTVWRQETHAYGEEFSFNVAHAALGAIVVGGIVWLIARNTPAGLLRRAKRAFPKDAHLIDIVKSDRPLISTIEKYYILYATPLASSFKDLVRENAGYWHSKELLDDLDKLLETMPDNATKAKLISESEAQRALITTSKPFIDAALMTIKQRPMFLEEQRANSNQEAADAASSAALSASLSTLANVTR